MLLFGLNPEQDMEKAVLRILFDPWVRDPGWVKNQHPDPGSGFGMNILDHNSEILHRNNFLG